MELGIDAVAGQQEGTFRDRMTLTGMVIVFLDFLSCIELFRNQRFDKTGALNVVIAVVLIQLVLTFAVVLVTWISGCRAISRTVTVAASVATTMQRAEQDLSSLCQSARQRTKIRISPTLRQSL